MGQTIRSSSLVPCGFVVEHVETRAEGTLIKVRPASEASGVGAETSRHPGRGVAKIRDRPGRRRLRRSRIAARRRRMR